MVLNVDIKARKATPIFTSTKKVANAVFGYAGSARINQRDCGYFIGLTYKMSPGKTEFEFAGDHRDLYQVDLESNEVTRLARGGEGSSYDWVVGTDGVVVAHSEYDNGAGIWRLYAGQDKAKLLLEKSDPLRDFQMLGRGRVPGTILISDSSSGATAAYEIAVANGKSERLFADQSWSHSLADPDRGFLIGVKTQSEPGAIFLNPKLQARIKGTRKAFPGLQMQLISFSHNLDRLIVKTDVGDDSGTYWLVDIASGNADPIGRPYSEIRKADVGLTKWVTYKASDGLDISAVLTLPPGGKSENLPLIVLPHGGLTGVSDAPHFNWWAQAFASAGYAVLQPNFRGSGSGEFLLAAYGQIGRKMQTDLSDGVATLSSRHIIDPKRVCIVGTDYGGYAALAGVTLQHDIYRCAVSVAGISDLSDYGYWLKTCNRRGNSASRYWKKLVGAEKENDSVMHTLSPVNLAEQANVPILLIHGKDDTVVPIKQSELMASALKNAKKSVPFIEMKGEDHWLSRDETRKTMLNAAVSFVREQNPP